MWNPARSNGPAVTEEPEAAAESNGVVPNSGHLVVPQQQKGSKAQLTEEVDQRESKGEVVDKDGSKSGSEKLQKVQEV